MAVQRRFQKSDAERLLNEGWALIDTSGRTKQLDEKSTIALCSKKIEYTVQYKAQVKQDAHATHSPHEKNEKVFFAKLHCVGLYYCLRDSLVNLPGVIICPEGFGSGGELKHYLKMMLGEDYDDEKIHVFSLREMFGKQNIADRLAYETNKKLKSPSLELKSHHLKRFFTESPADNSLPAKKTYTKKGRKR